jgi:hypothetical protein
MKVNRVNVVLVKALCCSMLVFVAVGGCAIWLRQRRGR